VWAAPAGGGGASRATTVVTTASLAVDASESQDVALGNTWNLITLVADNQCRVTLYIDATYESADVGRLITVTPTGPHGVIVDVGLDGTTVLPLSSTFGYTLEGASARIRVTNNGLASAVVAVTLVTLPVEA